MKTQNNKTMYLIIGNSAGGIGAVEGIRLADKTGAITIISDEPYPAYSRPMISEYLAKHATIERMLYRSPEFYDRNKVTTVLGTRVDSINVDKHLVKLASGETISWEKLLLATGGTPIISQVEGLARDRIFSFTTLGDAIAIDRFLAEHEGENIKAVVIGGGLIGFSVTEALVKRGVKVAMVEMKDRVLNTIVDEETSNLAAGALQNAGVEIITDHTVSRVLPGADGTPEGVMLDDGSPLPCHLVIMAIGVKPRLDLVNGTGIKTNRGILVDRHMLTSHPDIYACGDVAEAYDFVYGTNRLSPVWPNAYIGGRVAGLNMAGRPVDYAGGTAMNSLKYFGLSISSAGIAVPPDPSYELINRTYDHVNKRIIVKDGIIQGMVMCGDIDRSGIIFGLMRDRVNVNDFKDLLVSADFSLAALPETLWRERLGAVPVGFTASVTEPVEEEDAGGE